MHANNNIVYLDIQYIIDNSDLGVHLKNKVKKTQDKIKLELTIKQKLIKEKENDIKNKKNILKKEELDKNIKELDNLIKKYQIFRNDSSKTVFEEKKKYRLQILELLNPLVVPNAIIFLILGADNCISTPYGFHCFFMIFNSNIKADHCFGEIPLAFIVSVLSFILLSRVSHHTSCSMVFMSCRCTVVYYLSIYILIFWPHTVFSMKRKLI